MKATNNFKKRSNLTTSNASSLDSLTDASGNNIGTIVSSAVSSGIAGLAANVADDDITMAAMQTQISGNATTISNLNSNIVSVSQRTATLEGKATAIDSSLNFLATEKAKLSGGNSFSNGLNIFTNGNDTAVQITNLACSGNNSFAGGDKSTQIATGTITIGSSSGTTTTFYNPKIRGSSMVYDNPLKYYDASYSIIDNREITHKYYVDSAISSATNDVKSNVYNFCSSNVLVGGATTTQIKVDDTHYFLEYPCTGYNNNTSNKTNQNYQIKRVFINLPTTLQNGAKTVMCRSITIRFRMEQEFCMAMANFSNLATQDGDPHVAIFGTEQNYTRFALMAGTYGHNYIESTICLALSGAGNNVILHANGLSGTGLITNSATTSNTWKYATQSIRWNNSSTALTWTPCVFSAYTDSKIELVINLPNRLNYVGNDYWTLGYRYRVEILDSLPVIASTSSGVYSGFGFTNTDLKSYGGGAYFSDT